jgi:CheY-like chemotaxis protein
LVLGKPGLERPGGNELLAQRARDLLNISLANTERLIRLINDILDIAKIEQGRIQLRREALAPENLCRDAAAEMSALANNRGITVEVQLPPWLPSVLADRDRSVQIVINLLSNAIKFSSAGQRVVLSARRDGQMICFTVQDWGRGIAPEHQTRLFHKFQQIDSSATREVGGTGLGLAISKALVEEQGGRMWLESELAQGSSFSFTLPIAPGTTGGTGLSARPRALVAEASPSRRAELCAAFTAAGWELQSVGSAADLQSLAINSEVALIVIGLPLSHDDETLIRLLRGLPSTAETHILVLTDSSPGEQLRYVELIERAATPAAVVERATQLRAERHPLVLVVDDDPHVRPVLVRLLQRHGLRVVNASDGYGALAAVTAHRPDVVLLDIKMPGLDGFEVLRRMKANPETAHIPVIILTANDLSEPARAQGLDLGARAYLEKPIAYERLISAINAVITDGGQP